MLVVVQFVQTSWTKAARGGPLAQARGSVPSAFKLPQQLHQPCTLDILSFRAPFEQPERRVDPESLPLTLPTLRIEPDGDGVAVTYVWDRHYVGAPARWRSGSGGMEVPVTRSIGCGLGEWVRVRYNGRSGEGRYEHHPWSYLGVVANVGVFEAAASVARDVFVTGEPARELDERMVLR
ncbi:MAG: hypothetical protein CMJ44_12920 [Pimelobacter sp.]|nr:hypothetical protein [Pimelobacter sp.]